MKGSTLMQASDSRLLLEWYQQVRRHMPWRDTCDPYRIWLSEIMLQQTRVDQAKPYYERFVHRFPNVHELAKANIDDILRLWEGLGYYSRARNLHKAAQQIVGQHDGRFPDRYDKVIALQGIGPYTAAAVLSIAFGQPYAAVDGNVTRVISRYFAIGDDVRRTDVQKEIRRRANAMLDRSRPGDFNQAMMELGATICKPGHPECGKCPLQNSCRAYQTDRVHYYPFKSPAKTRPHYHIAIGVVRDGAGRLLIARRPEEAMLGGLWEFPGGKQEGDEPLTKTVRRELDEELGIRVAVEEHPFEVVHHAYSHFTITMHAFYATMHENSSEPAAKNGEPFTWVTADELTEYAFPKANRKITETLSDVYRQPTDRT